MTTIPAKPPAPAAPKLPPFGHTPSPYAGPTKAEVIALRRQHLTPALITYYKDPVMIVEGRMQYLFDEKGRRYLDAFAGIVTVIAGHSHPKIVEAAKRQCELLQHTTTIYLHPTIARFAQRLAATFPEGSGLDRGVVYFVNSGSEANDLAIMLARLKTGNFDVVALRNAYHGMTSSTMGLAGLSTWRQPLPHGSGFHHARAPDRYRGPWGYDDPHAAAKYAAEVADLIKGGTCGQVAAFIAEPIQGVGGAVELPPGYLPLVYKSIREAGGLCISDEVQTGFGRTGSHFWGFEAHGVTPDIVTVAKGIGNGIPLAACITRPEIAGAMTRRLHFNTYGGNPLSMAQGLATLDVIQEESLQQRAGEIGAYLKDGLLDLQKRHALVGDVRGQGLLLGVELVEDRASKAPATAKTALVHERAKDLGLLVGKGGLASNVLRIKPPLCITKADCDFLCGVLDVCLSECG